MSEYDPYKLREYAALTNNPILYCLTYTSNTHRIGTMWAYEWLIDFVKTSDPVAFHPEALKLIKKNLPNWTDPYKKKNDYQLFLEAVFPDWLEGDRMIIEAITQDKLLYKDRVTNRWTLL